MVPLPLVGVETAWVPTARMILLAAVTTLVTAVEGTGGVGPMMAGLFWGQALLWSAICWGFGWGFARALAVARPAFRQRIAFLLAVAVAVAAAIAVLVPIYTTPYSANSARSTLLQVYR